MEIRLCLSVKADHSKFYYYIVHYRGLLVKKNSLNSVQMRFKDTVNIERKM